MPLSEATFESELDIFRKETDSAVQFFYAWRSMNEVAASSPSVLKAMNASPLFWMTTGGALQLSGMIALGRIFDQERETHNIDRVIRIAQTNMHLFSHESLKERKRRSSSNAEEWIDEYMTNVYVPTIEDFRRLRRHVSARRRVYEETYRPIRHKVFAHKMTISQSQVQELFANAKIRELQQLLIFLRRLHLALQELYLNGAKPILRPARFSSAQMRVAPSPYIRGATLQERIVRETEAVLKSLPPPQR